jgi:hypothetical protein
MAVTDELGLAAMVEGSKACLGWEKMKEIADRVGIRVRCGRGSMQWHEVGEAAAPLRAELLCTARDSETEKG